MKQWMTTIVAVWVICACCPPFCALGQAPADDGPPLFTADGRGNDGKPPRRPLTDDEMVELRRREMLQDFDAETSLDQGMSIHPRLMEAVKDNSMGVRFEERQSYLRVLRLAQEVPLRRQQRFAAELQSERQEANPVYARRRSKDFPQFVDLFMNPDVYRGHPVTLHGTLRKLTKFELGKNNLDLETAYEGWVYPPDSQGNPVVVVFTSKDENLPVHGDLQEEVAFTGYFFKMYGYDAEDTTRKAPLILAGEMTWIPRSPRPNMKAWLGLGWGWYYDWLPGIFVLGCYLFWQSNRREMPPRPPLAIEPDFKHWPPREHPAPDPFQPNNNKNPEDA